MSRNKEQALKNMGIDVHYDVMSDGYILMKRIPQQITQINVSRARFEDDSIDAFVYALTNSYLYDDEFVHPGPTTKELRDPRIKHAYEEMQILRKLIGANK
jgi:hypothetical protein